VRVLGPGGLFLPDGRRDAGRYPDPGVTADPADTMAPATPGSSPAPTAQATAAPAGSEPAPSGGTGVTPVIDAAWANLTLTDVRTGQAFTIADLAGKVIFVEPMAAWCSKCKAQQEIAKGSVAALSDVVYISLGVDPGESDATLAKYADRSGFPWTHAVATRDVARALADAFGPNVLNPPATPIIVIGTDGKVTLTPFGEKSAEQLVDLAREHGAGT
jgi:thiol-disulfide isomerase/thioredoxin